ncbi:hypothetical protein V0288_09495 [Pannus brasiliensis CCIBt3594]|uniref:Uncharacterized protein n=1 Tax=Pannus brasiliensis CCIBt3594 TaxID=1427578 RepID=A0AAW9QRD8_9CHRO
MTKIESPENSGARSAETDRDPSIALEEARNANEGKSPNAAGSTASSTAEDHVPGRSDPEPSDLPSSDHPKPD